MGVIIIIMTDAEMNQHTLAAPAAGPLKGREKSDWQMLLQMLQVSRLPPDIGRRGNISVSDRLKWA